MLLLKSKLGSSYLLSILSAPTGPNLDCTDLATLIHATLSLWLDYCNALDTKTVWKLQLVQNAAARLLTGLCPYDQITLGLWQLH